MKLRPHPIENKPEYKVSWEVYNRLAPNTPYIRRQAIARMSVVRRLCGYLGHPNKRPVVSGKQDEISARVKHN